MVEIPLDEKSPFSLEVTRKNGKYLYRFKEEEKEIRLMRGKSPIEITGNTDVGRQIKSLLNPNGRLSTRGCEEQMLFVLKYIREKFELEDKEKEREDEEKQEKLELDKQEKMGEAREYLENLEEPLVFIGSVVDWIAAGERENIMLCFLAYASQIILHYPISVVSLGESSSGKTYIQDSAAEFIPSEFRVLEKFITPAALFRRAEQDPFFYDGKIINYGDMGGEKDQEFMRDSKNLMKELQSEGFLSKPLMSGENKDELKELKLYGKPALTYTSVPNFKIDDQELSRSILITPRLDNEDAFKKREAYLELGGKTAKLLKEIEIYTDLIKYMVYWLREELSEKNIKIVNPYYNLINALLGSSEFYKRDIKKYTNLLKVITAFNYFNREKMQVDDELVMYVSLQDFQLLFSVLDQYLHSISDNLSKGASQILLELNNTEFIDLDFTINDYFEKTNLKISKSSIRTYFSELNEKGFIKVVGKDGRSSLWNLTNKTLQKIDIHNWRLTDATKKMIHAELGSEALEIIERDTMKESLSIKNQAPNIPVPPWSE